MLRLKSNKYEVSDELSDDVKRKVVRTLSPVASTTAELPIPFIGELGGQINLIRAVNDEAQSVIDSIDAELENLESRRSQLILQRQAHVEMLEVAQRYVNVYTISITPIRSKQSK